jgi:hypothetical protein
MFKAACVLGTLVMCTACGDADHGKIQASTEPGPGSQQSPDDGALGVSQQPYVDSCEADGLWEVNCADQEICDGFDLVFQIADGLGVQAAGECGAWFSVQVDPEACVANLRGFADCNAFRTSFPVTALGEIQSLLLADSDCAFACSIKKTTNPPE